MVDKMAPTRVQGPPQTCLRGLRMDADVYLALPEDNSYRYELVNGVVCLSPSPTFRHQMIITEVAVQIGGFLRNHPLGTVAVEVDLPLGKDLVYRPDVVYLSAAKAAKCGDAIVEIPDLVAEVVSPDSRTYDSRTKREDYEAAGVGEYWLIDPDRESFAFLVLRGGRFTEASVDSDRGPYRPAVLPGFALDLNRIRLLF